VEKEEEEEKREKAESRCVQGQLLISAPRRFVRLCCGFFGERGRLLNLFFEIN